MARINENFNKLPGSYLFSEIARRVAAYSAENPDRSLIRLGIGDVTRPLPAAVTAAMHKAVDEMATAQGFHGYGPEQGYDFLREAIAQYDYKARGVDIKPEEIFVSDGAKSDCGNIGDIFDKGRCATRCTPSMWIPMPWQAGPVSTTPIPAAGPTWSICPAWRRTASPRLSRRRRWI